MSRACLLQADGGLGSSSGAGGSFEVLHDFAQICMVAADRIKGVRTYTYKFSC